MLCGKIFGQIGAGAIQDEARNRLKIRRSVSSYLAVHTAITCSGTRCTPYVSQRKAAFRVTVPDTYCAKTVTHVGWISFCVLLHLFISVLPCRCASDPSAPPPIESQCYGSGCDLAYHAAIKYALDLKLPEFSYRPVLPSFAGKSVVEMEI